jgi:hypothetical protein
VLWSLSWPDLACPPLSGSLCLLGGAAAEDLPRWQQEEMMAFVQRELRTPHWLRALSLDDKAASLSDRKDHGPFGSYDGWLGMDGALPCCRVSLLVVSREHRFLPPAQARQ